MFQHLFLLEAEGSWKHSWSQPIDMFIISTANFLFILTSQRSLAVEPGGGAPTSRDVSSDVPQFGPVWYDHELDSPPDGRYSSLLINVLLISKNV